MYQCTNSRISLRLNRPLFALRATPYYGNGLGDADFPRIGVGSAVEMVVARFGVHWLEAILENGALIRLLWSIQYLSGLCAHTAVLGERGYNHSIPEMGRGFDYLFKCCGVWKFGAESRR